MHRKHTAVFFALIFSFFLITPVVVSVVEKNFDVSVFFNISEEESKENETNTNLKITFVSPQKYISSFFLDEFTLLPQFTSKNYYEFCVENISPPPECC